MWQHAPRQVHLVVMPYSSQVCHRVNGSDRNLLDLVQILSSFVIPLDDTYDGCRHKMQDFAGEPQMH